jgi:hypothetical protein
MMALLVNACESPPSPPPDLKRGTAAKLLLDAPHRRADSLAAMPSIAAIEKDFKAALEAVVDGDLAAARKAAAGAGYVAVESRQFGRRYTILLERDGAGIGPAIAVAASPVRDAVLQAPHSLKDAQTDRQAVILFFRLGARALILSGAHRCAAREASSCSGKTRVCGGGRGSYRTSDAAHNSDMLFHVAHRFFSRRWPRSVAVQFHGFRNVQSPVWFVISDGSKERRPVRRKLAERVRDSIRDTLGRDDRAVSCQDIDDRSITTRWLCATTTVQGRELNNSPDICRVPAERSSGRFLHIEQTYDEVRRAYGQGFSESMHDRGAFAIRKALERQLPCIRKNCKPVRRR